MKYYQTLNIITRDIFLNIHVIYHIQYNILESKTYCNMIESV